MSFHYHSLSRLSTDVRCFQWTARDKWAGSACLLRWRSNRILSGPWGRIKKQRVVYTHPQNSWSLDLFSRL